MVPPQERPTSQAVSSATPNSSVFGLPLSITSSASVTTAPSTQPPDTEPRKLPSPSITRFDPTPRGAEPQVSTTVASATPRPSFRQSSAALRMSSSRASIGASMTETLRPVIPGPSAAREPGIHNHDLGAWIPASSLRGCPAMTPKRRYHNRTCHSIYSRDSIQPSLRIACPCALFRKRVHQIRHRLEVVDRAQLIDVRQHRADAPGLGLEAREAQQGVEPDQAAARPVQPVHFEGKLIAA